MMDVIQWLCQFDGQAGRKQDHHQWQDHHSCGEHYLWKKHKGKHPQLWLVAPGWEVWSYDSAQAVVVNSATWWPIWIEPGMAGSEAPLGPGP